MERGVFSKDIGTVSNIYLLVWEIDDEMWAERESKGQGLRNTDAGEFGGSTGGELDRRSGTKSLNTRETNSNVTLGNETGGC